jgi:anti-sigma28 factor (negative regulator of flagellin synthesis)
VESQKDNLSTKANKESSKNCANVDTISISYKATKQSDIGNIVKNMAKELNQEVKQDRIEFLKSEVANKKYSVSTERLADAILNKTDDD